MIDIHAHILPFVDDGSKGLAQSLEMVKKELDLGVNALVLTPHYRFDYKPTRAEVLNSFEALKEKLREDGCHIELYLGQELYIDNNYKDFIANSQDFICVNGAKNVLIEFDLGFYSDILSTVYELIRLGYRPIVAHIERYFYADIDLAVQVKNLGGLIQVNADSIVGKNKRKYKKLTKKLFKLGLVDFVASDIHWFRENLMGKAYDFVTKKYGKELAEKVFIENAQKMLKG